MSQKDDSENDIWEYKPLEKKKKTHESPLVKRSRDVTLPRTSRGHNRVPVKSPDVQAKTAQSGRCRNARSFGSCDIASKSSPASGTVQTDTAAEGHCPTGDFCPMCQMPFSILVVQTQRWHVAECLDTPRDTCKECPNGLRCFSTIPNHFKKFNHTLLAHSRANGDTSPLGLSLQAETSGPTRLSCHRGTLSSDADGSVSESSSGSTLSLSASLNRSDSPRSELVGTPASKLTNGLLLLRSPGPEDFKKKKGWSPSAKSPKSISSSQESRRELSSTPVEPRRGVKACEGLLKSQSSPDNNDAISYSPLSEFPAETEVGGGDCRKALFDKDTFEKGDENSALLLADFIDHLEGNKAQVKEPLSCSPQLYSVTSSPPTNQPAASAVANRVDSKGEKEAPGKCTSAISPRKSSVQSPQSIVLERLRETLLSSDSPPLQNVIDSSIPGPSSQASTVQRSQPMPPQKGQVKAGQGSSSLKQTDIGVFFGLKPLKAKEKVAESGPGEVDAASVPGPGGKGKEGPRKRRAGADASADASQGAATGSDGHAANARGDAEKRGTRGWRGRRWSRGGAGGDGESPRCPFYKKIPGTKFAIDAFHYGEIQGIAAYFLTHFHSDHYGGLTKKSTLPIYCNRITGNLVKSKLRVAEQYVHVLPMNTRVTVEGIEVVLLEANHCPGAAMLLFFLPDGQTVLHTGDFRADPSMETCPELLGCRVQTLYLDTTYCSPEYAFPTQQEVINFAANTAFELVTLNPRTLVVCGSYSVGKEKVFLALAEVLGSKVCLSRDKYNTMCCLESEQVRQSITTDWKAARVHVLPMMHLSFKKLQDYLARFSARYDQLVAFKPTGWTFSQQVESVGDIQPQISGSISIYGIPYSEHSSFLEMKRFVQWLRPLKIIPTVNNGSWDSRKAMEKYFSEWLAETKTKP
uniref:DNA cross-link repair 1A protein n=1 Tax=Gasterosteus aculeatus aculeatus TaxID=481459 RepID=A0AAQ4RSZ4_GASAC|nr:DNA cross-link repair 1A protein isoform X1 [Gasterosteus aculeatus aculeatus]